MKLCQECKSPISHSFNKRCKNCWNKHRQPWKSEEEKSSYIKKRKDEWFQKNKKRLLKKRLKRKKENPSFWKDREFKYHLKSKYNLTIEEYNDILKKQKNRCAICGIRQKKNDRSLKVDHNHKTGKVRGLLCFNCNIAVGHFKDDIKLLQKTINYLEI